MTVPPNPARLEGVLAQQAHGETVLLRLSDGFYYRVDEVGAFIWEQCDGTRTVDQVVAAVVAEFDAPAAVVATDVREFLSELVAEQLLVEPA